MSIKKKAKSTKFILVGGLGNQLFIYAAGLFLQERTKSRVSFDVSELRHGITNHRVDIRALNPNGAFFDSRFARLIRHLVIKTSTFGRSRGGPKKSSYLYESPVLGFDGELEAASRYRYVSGYFQTWKYLADPLVREQIDRLNVQSPTNWHLATLEKMKTKTVLSVHVRRGDYDKHRLTFGQLSVSYYELAILSALRQSKEPFTDLYVFSDDINEARKLFAFEYLSIPVSFITPPLESPAEETLFIMSESTAMVISNSTFAWWAASLGRKDKSVFYPSNWFRSHEIPQELIPKNWTAIQSSWSE